MAFLPVIAHSQDFPILAKAAKVADLAQALVSGAKIDDRSNNGQTALMFAAGFNPDPSTVVFLIGKGAAVDARTLDGWTPLIFAAEFGVSSDAVVILVHFGAAIGDKDSSSKTALHHAASVNKNPVVCTALLSSGASVSDVDSLGWTPLMRAARNPNVQILELLIQAGSDINFKAKDGMTALMAAALLSSDPRSLTILLSAGTDPKAEDNKGKNALEYAKFNVWINGTPEFWEMNDASFR